MRDFNALDPTCITVPPIQLVMSEPHFIDYLEILISLFNSYEMAISTCNALFLLIASM